MLNGVSCIPKNLALVARAMRPGGEWRIASDDPTYQAWTSAVLGEPDLVRGAGTDDGPATRMAVDTL